MSKHKKNRKKNPNQSNPAELTTVYPQSETDEAAEDITEEEAGKMPEDLAEDAAEASEAAMEEVSEEVTAVSSEEAVEEPLQDQSEEAVEEPLQEQSEETSEETTEETAEEVKAEDASEESSSETTEDETSDNADESEEKEETDETAEEKSDEKIKVITHDEEKKYKVNRNNLKAQTESERIRREARRKRRIRQQVLAYSFLVLFVLVVGLGIFLGVRKIVHISSEKKAAAEAEALLEQQRIEEEEAAAQEEALVSEAPVYTVEDLGATPQEQLDETIHLTIDSMTLEEKVQGIMFVTPESLTGVDRVLVAGDGTAKALEEFCPGGIIYSAKNVNSSEQFIQMLEKTPSLAKYPIFYCTSETGLNESGLVGCGQITGAMAPRDAAATGSVESIVSVGTSIGTGLSGAGIDVDFAPVCDLDVVPGGTQSNTTYGNDASVITPYVTGMADGLSEGGVIAAYRYFPSLAASSQNPAAGRATCDRSLDDFRSQEFQVWLSAINAGAGMIQMSNVIYPSIDSDMLPSSLSEKTVTGVLRDELKYDGVIISGPLNDAAITAYYTSGDSAVMALKAGCDVICCPSDPKAAADGIVQAVGSGVVSEERINDALIRLYRIRYADKYDELKSQYEAKASLMGVDLSGVTY